jgi:hypothetical protein
MIEDGIPEILAETCLGHLVPGMRGLYSHVSERNSASQIPPTGTPNANAQVA